MRNNLERIGNKQMLYSQEDKLDRELKNLTRRVKLYKKEEVVKEESLEDKDKDKVAKEKLLLKDNIY
jgi:hypothetical protein